MGKSKKLISVVTPCYNEEANIENTYNEIKRILEPFTDKYEWEHVFIDNGSKDRTVSILKTLAQEDYKVKIIINTRNFGFVRSCFYGLIQPDGDAVILIFADLQDPPYLIPEFIKRWEEGYKVVWGVKENTEEAFLLSTIKRLYYFVTDKLAENVELTRNITGFGLYDKQVIQMLRTIDDPYPYFKGLVSELGFENYLIKYKQAVRKKGSGAKFYALYDYAMLGITSHSRIPLRIATILGFGMSMISLIVALGYYIHLRKY